MSDSQPSVTTSPHTLNEDHISSLWDKLEIAQLEFEGCDELIKRKRLGAPGRRVCLLYCTSLPTDSSLPRMRKPSIAVHWQGLQKPFWSLVWIVRYLRLHFSSRSCLNHLSSTCIAKNPPSSIRDSIPRLAGEIGLRGDGPMDGPTPGTTYTPDAGEAGINPEVPNEDAFHSDEVIDPQLRGECPAVGSRTMPHVP
jgi:hypothetical protein